jgi:hypothetical protein
VVESEFVPAEQVQQAAGAGDGDIGALADAVDLRLHAHAAVDGDVAQAGAGAQLEQDILGLLGQLAGGADNQRAQLPARAGQQAVEHGQHERGGFAGTGLGQADDIAAFENGRDGFFLNGGCQGIALRLDVSKKLGIQAQGMEAHDRGFFPVAGCVRWGFTTPSGHASTEPPRSVHSGTGTLRHPGEHVQRRYEGACGQAMYVHFEAVRFRKQPGSAGTPCPAHRRMGGFR